MLRTRTAALLAVVALLVGLGIAPGALAQEICQAVDQSTDEVLEGVTLTWDTAFLCENAPDEDEYTITVNVTNQSDQMVTIEALALSHTTPRPKRQSPDASASATGLPLQLGPGERGSFIVRGDYELVETDEGMKANLHLRASGAGDGGDSFALGVNVHLRGGDAVEDGGDADNGTDEENGEGASVEVRHVSSDEGPGAQVEVVHDGDGSPRVTVRVMLPFGVSFI